MASRSADASRTTRRRAPSRSFTRPASTVIRSIAGWASPPAPTFISSIPSIRKFSSIPSVVSFPAVASPPRSEAQGVLMPRDVGTRVVQVLDKHERELLGAWVDSQLEAPMARRDLIAEPELREQSREFLHRVREAAARGGVSNIDTPAWEPVRELLRELSTERARRGFTPTETASFVFSLKEPLFARLRQELGMDAHGLAEETWAANQILDALGLYTTEIHQQGRESLIARQAQEMLELSTPVVELWDGVLALPVIGTLDSVRTQVVMENLLQRIVETGATIAIIDITGVPTVDTLVA